MIDLPYDEVLVKEIAVNLDLRDPNAAALDALARAMDGAAEGAELVADLATGVGKTYIAGGLIDYLERQGVRNVVIITPGSAVQRKTIANLTPGHPKYVRGMQSRPVVVTLDDVQTGTVGQALRDGSKLKVFVLTVQSLLRPDTKDNRRAHRPHEMLGEALSEYLADAEDLVVIADEHHTYFGSTAKRFRAAVEELRPAVLVGLTATPHEASEPNVVYRYPLAEAIADGYVKIPVLVARSDGMKDLRTQLADGVALLDAKDGAMRAYSAAARQPYVRPVMFVVADNVAEAGRISEMLAGADLLGDPDLVLQVTSDQSDEMLAQLDVLEHPDSRHRAVVSVSMLKEGWDVKNIYVIAAVRALESQLLTEQVLGRGLRLPFGKRTGVGMLDTVEVLSHRAFRDLLAQAEALLLQTVGQRATEATAVAQATPGVQGESVDPSGLLAAVDGTGAGEVVVTLPGRAAADPAVTADGDGMFDDDDGAVGHQVAGIGTVDDRLAGARAAAQALARPVVPQQLPGVPLPMFIPRVTVRMVRDPFSLTRIDTLDVEALGRRFADDNAPTLKRKAIEARRDETGVRVEIRDRSDEHVAASQTRLPFDTVELDLVQRLMSSNAVEASLAEANAATGIARAFLQGAGVTEQTPWAADHARLATASLVGWIGRQQTSTPAVRKVEVVQVRWPDPAEQLQNTAPANRAVVTRPADFVRGHPYLGWAKGVYPVASFDAYGTEFRLAELFDTSPAVRGWVRVTNTVPLAIAYPSGSGTRNYVPDFVVVDDQGTHWVVEGKSDGDMADEVVLAKRDAAADWVRTVNASDKVQATWAYLLVSESVVRSAAGWDTLKAAGQTFR